MRYEGLEKGATPFSRPEGIIIEIHCTYVAQWRPFEKGQIWKIIPVNKKPRSSIWY